MHVEGSQKTAADHLMMQFRNKWAIPHEEKESEQEFLTRKELSKQRVMEENEQQHLTTILTGVINLPLKSAVYTFGAIKENARIHHEQVAPPY